MPAKALGGGVGLAAAVPWGVVGTEDTATRSLPELPTAGTADLRQHGAQLRLRGALPRSWGAGGWQEHERNHVRRLPTPLGPGGPVLQLGRLGEPGG